jgi:hypothetical protein
MSDKPTDRFSENVKIENSRPAGGEIHPTNLQPIPPRPTPTPDDFGGYRRQRCRA